MRFVSNLKKKRRTISIEINLGELFCCSFLVKLTVRNEGTGQIRNILTKISGFSIFSIKHSENYILVSISKVKSDVWPNRRPEICGMILGQVIIHNSFND